MQKVLSLAALAVVVSIGSASATRAEGWWPFGAAAMPAANTERYVAHSSFRLILQQNGRYVANTIVKSIPVVQQVARRALPYAVEAGVAATAPAWATVAATSAAIVGTSYAAYEAYNFVRDFF